MDDTPPKTGFEADRQGRALKEAFSAQFGGEGQALVVELIECGRLNGGVDLSGNPTSDIGAMQGDFYPGEAYAHATGYYFMRRALGEMNEDDAYAEFLLDVEGIDTSRNLKQVNGRFPSQDWMEKLCQPYFEELEEIGTPKSTLSM